MTTTIEAPVTLGPRWRAHMRHRKRHLTNLRTFLFKRKATETAEQGKAHGRTEGRLRSLEQEIREYNSLAADAGYPTIKE